MITQLQHIAKSRFIYIISFASIALLTSCFDQEEQSLKDAMNSAGKNRKELEKVLEYYSNPSDSLKLKAARFLIKNMQYHHGYYGNEVDKYSRIFSIIDTSSYKKEWLSETDKLHIVDSVYSRYGNPAFTNDNEISDVNLITSKLLACNIDFAFKAWQRAPWKKKVNFSDFCEYILPYRVLDEQIQYWRPQLYKSYTSLVKSSANRDSLRSAFECIKGNIEWGINLSGPFSGRYPFTPSVDEILKGKIGSCKIISFLSVTAMRGAGLPAALDFVPHWGNYGNGHYMPRLIDHAKNPPLFSNYNGPGHNGEIVSFSSDYHDERHYFQEAEIPKGMYIQHIKTVPKVYRHTFSADSSLKAINHNVSSSFISPLFRQVNFKDVTEEYMKSAFAVLEIPDSFKEYKAVHLCVFDTKGWEAVAISEIKGRYVVFDKLGTSVIYLPTVYNGTHLAIGPPFYVDSLNVIHKFKPDVNKKEGIEILRKAPLYSYTAYHTETLKGGRFEGANTADFSHPQVLYEINNYPFYMNEVNVNTKKRFRYLRFVFPKEGSWEADNIAEVQFYAPSNSNKPLSGQLIGVNGTPDHEISKAFDNDMNSYYENAKNNDGWIGIDLGENKEIQVSKIRFCPRNDTNCIMPGNEYELYYWNGRWISLGAQKAVEYRLSYKNIPLNSLLWLRCKSGGAEERIFTICSGEQLWW